MEDCPIHNPIKSINTNYKSVFLIYISLSPRSLSIQETVLRSQAWLIDTHLPELKSGGRNKAQEVTHRQKFRWQVTTVVDPAVHGYEPLHSGLILHTGVVETSVQHDDGKRQHVTGVCNKTEGNRIYVDVMNQQLKHQTNFMQQRTH